MRVNELRSYRRYFSLYRVFHEVVKNREFEHSHEYEDIPRVISFPQVLSLRMYFFLLSFLIQFILDLILSY